MFQGFTQQTFEFMWNLRFNNEKSWFEAHKDEYRTVLAQPMSSFFFSNTRELSYRSVLRIAEEIALL